MASEMSVLPLGLKRIAPFQLPQPLDQSLPGRFIGRDARALAHHVMLCRLYFIEESLIFQVPHVHAVDLSNLGTNEAVQGVVSA
jgi:hypothetical protein